LFKDLLGRLLKKANSFKKTLVFITSVCFLRIKCFYNKLSNKYQENYGSISNNFYYLYSKTSFEIISIKARSKTTRNETLFLET
jgi:hypothetical protein